MLFPSPNKQARRSPQDPTTWQRLLFHRSGLGHASSCSCPILKPVQIENRLFPFPSFFPFFRVTSLTQKMMGHLRRARKSNLFERPGPKSYAHMTFTTHNSKGIKMNHASFKRCSGDPAQQVFLFRKRYCLYPGVPFGRSFFTAREPERSSVCDWLVGLFHSTPSVRDR